LQGERDRTVDACPDEGTAVDLVPRARYPDVPCRPTPPPVDAASPLLRAITFGARAVIVAVDPAKGWSPLSDSFGTADLPQLFHAFFRGSNVVQAGGRQHTPGTGLGLVVSRAIVELHGGTISVASTAGVGTTVTLSLPMRPARTGG
jgi:hypothetical protein